jgi:hypothetical protein
MGVNAMMTGDIDGTNLEGLAAATSRQVEIVAQYPNGALRMGHPGVSAPIYEQHGVDSGLLERVELSDPTVDPYLYLLVLRGAGKKAVESRGDPQDRIMISDARKRVEESFGNG